MIIVRLQSLYPLVYKGIPVFLETQVKLSLTAKRQNVFWIFFFTIQHLMRNCVIVKNYL